MKQIISTEGAPKAIGTYSQAVKHGNTVYISGQIPLVPETMEVCEGDFSDRVRQAFRNLEAIVAAAGGELSNVVKLTIYLLDMNEFDQVNAVMSEVWEGEYPARAVVAVAGLPKGVDIEMDAIMVLD